MPPHRIRIDTDKDEFINSLADIGDGSDGSGTKSPFSSKADVLAFAAAYGASNNKFEEVSDPTKSPIRYEVFEDRALNPLFNILAVYKTQGVDVLSEEKNCADERADIFEGYSNGGLALLQKKLAGFQDPLTRLLLLIENQKRGSGSTIDDFLKGAGANSEGEEETENEE